MSIEDEISEIDREVMGELKPCPVNQDHRVEMYRVDEMCQGNPRDYVTCFDCGIHLMSEGDVIGAWNALPRPAANASSEAGELVEDRDIHIENIETILGYDLEKRPIAKAIFEYCAVNLSALQQQSKPVSADVAGVIKSIDPNYESRADDFGRLAKAILRNLAGDKQEVEGGS